MHAAAAKDETEARNPVRAIAPASRGVKHAFAAAKRSASPMPHAAQLKPLAGPRRRAFVIDDEPDIRILIQRMLELRGCEVFTFEDPTQFCTGTDCVGRQNGHCPCGDYIISDVRMPHMDGLTFAERQLSKGCLIPNLALMSGDWAQRDMDRAQALPVTVLHKPVDLNTLDEWLASCEESIDPDRILSDKFSSETTP